MPETTAIASKGEGVILTPDPSALTRTAINQEIGALKELIFVRLDAMDEAIRVAKADLVRVPTDVDKQVGNLRDLMHEKFTTEAEKFNGIQVQFEERDVRVKESTAAATTAVNAALQAAKEAVGAQNASFTLGIDKSEKATLEQINQQRVLLEKTGESLDEKISDVKERLTRLESLGTGRAGAATDQRGNLALVFSALFALIALVSLVYTLTH